MEPANRWLHNQTSPRNRIQIGGSHEKFNPNRSRIGLCSRCQWQSPYHSFPRQEGPIAAYSGLEGIQVATSHDIAEQIVLQPERKFFFKQFANSHLLFKFKGCEK